MKKRSIWKKAIAGALAIALMLGAFPAVNCVRVEAAVKLEHTKGKNAKDVAALKKLIAKAQKQGANVSTDLNSWDYTWEKGKLVGLNWVECKLTGAWNFSSLKNLKELDCSVGAMSIGNSNHISSLNVSKCTKLEKLECIEIGLKKLNASGCTKLTELDCYWNELEKLDVSKCPKLTSLSCGDNKLSKLDVSGCPKLTSLSCDNNKLSKLNVSKCPKLTELWCKNNKLKEVTVSKKAEDLYVSADDGVKIVKK